MNIKDQVKEQIELLQTLDEPSERFLFFQSTFKKFNPLELGKFNALTEGEWLGLFLIANNDSTISLDEVKRRIALIDELIAKDFSNNLEMFLTYIDKVMNDLADFRKNNFLLDLAKEIKRRPQEKSELKLLDLIVTCYRENNDKALDQWKEILGFKLEYTVGLDYLKEKPYLFTAKDTKRAFKYGIKSLKDAYHFTPLIQVLQNYQSNYLHELERNNKKKRVLKEQYEDLLEELEKDPTFREIRKEWASFTPDIQIALIKKVLETQNKKEKALRQEEQDLENHNLIYNLLIKQGVHPSILMELEKESFKDAEVKEIIDLLNQARFPLDSITNKESLKAILQASKEAITHLLSYYKTGALSLDFLNNSMDFLMAKEDNVKRVFDLLQQENGAFTVPSYDPSILFINSDTIEERINLAKQYGFTLGNNPDTYNLLREEALFDLVDFALERELPIAEVIKMKGTKEELLALKKRLVIAQNFGLEIMNDEDEIRNSLLTGSSFIVPANLLDEIIIDNTPVNQDEKIVAILTKYPRRKINENAETKTLDDAFLDAEKECYNFAGVRISRNKLLRNLTTLSDYYEIDNNLIYQVAIYNTILSQSELNTLKQCLQPKEKRI